MATAKCSICGKEFVGRSGRGPIVELREHWLARHDRAWVKKIAENLPRTT